MHATVFTLGDVSQQHQFVWLYLHPTQRSAHYMQELEKQFPEPPLLPASEELRAEVQDMCQHASGAVTTYTASGCKACAQAC